LSQVIFSILLCAKDTTYSYNTIKGEKMPWNDENVARLKELWDQGLPTAQIGKLLSFTKNAVVGKAHRIGLERRPSPIRRTAVKPDRKKARSPVMPKLNFENTEPEENIYASIIKIFQPPIKNIFNGNSKRGCEWPEGHPDESEFHFCNKDRFEDKPYCLDHCAIAYVILEKEENKPIARSSNFR
jgi:GcrA cell cycle regulator